MRASAVQNEKEDGEKVKLLTTKPRESESLVPKDSKVDTCYSLL
jgi:hypothetical protein